VSGADPRWRQAPPDVPGVRTRRRRDRLGDYWVFEVRWTDPGTRRKLSKTFDTPADARDHQAQLRLLRRRGTLGDLDRGRETLDAFAAEWLEHHAAAALARATLRAYATTYNLHLAPRVGGLALREIRPVTVDRLKQALLDDGVGSPTVLKALAVLSSMFSLAVVWDRVDANPVRAVRKPRAARAKVIEALSVEVDEALIGAVRDRAGHPAQWMLVELMAYTGARPQDALALPFSAIGERRLVYAAKNLDGRIVRGAKTGASKSRSVALLRHVAADLRAYRAAQPPAPSGLVLVRPDGLPWREHDYKNWSAKRPRGRPRADASGTRSGALGPFTAAARAIGRPDITPYFLRHTYASLRIAEQRLSLQEIAAELGHSVQVLSDHYAHVVAEYAGAGAIDPDLLIARARAGRTTMDHGRQEDAMSQDPRREPHEMQRLAGTSRQADARIRTGDPFITSEVLYQLSYVGAVQADCR
jgi:integrase